MTPTPQRRSLLEAAHGFALIARSAPLGVLHSWLSTWTGVGHVIDGMHRQGYDVQLTQYEERGWRATFYVTGMEHSATSSTASAWEPTPWRAVQRAGLTLCEHDRPEVTMPRAERRICLLCGRAFGLVMPPGEEETERDKLCGVCRQLPPPPSGPEE